MHEIPERCKVTAPKPYSKSQANDSGLRYVLEAVRPCLTWIHFLCSRKKPANASLYSWLEVTLPRILRILPT